MHPPLDKECNCDVPRVCEPQVPGLGLSFTGNYGALSPVTVHMQGHYRSPDFEVTTSTNKPLFTVETESTLVFHVVSINDLRPNGVTYTLKRKTDGDVWSYTMLAHGKDGVKLLEIVTTPKLLAADSIPLIFRSKADGELDALRLHIVTHKAVGRSMEITYHGQPVGRMVQAGSERKPAFRLDIEAARVDPLLFVVFALVVDDRLMTQRRRLRRPLMSGFAGIGKGPGAGLAGAYALGC